VSKALRDRRNRRDDTIRGSVVLLGGSVSARKYCSGRVDVTIHVALPGDARTASVCVENGLLPAGG